MNPSYTKVKAIFDALERLQVRREVRAGEICHSEVVGVQKDEPVSKAVQLMRRFGYSQLPVFDGGRPIGSISEKTILRQILDGKSLRQISTLPVRDVMDEEFPQVGEDAPLSLISNLLHVYPAVLVTRRGRVTGIITKADLLKMFS